MFILLFHPFQNTYETLSGQKGFSWRQTSESWLSGRCSIQLLMEKLKNSSLKSEHINILLLLAELVSIYTLYGVAKEKTGKNVSETDHSLRWG